MTSDAPEPWLLPEQPWPLPEELRHMDPQFRLGYLQARDDGMREIERLRAIIRVNLLRRDPDTSHEAIDALLYRGTAGYQPTGEDVSDQPPSGGSSARRQ